MSIITTTSDPEVQRAVESELRWASEVDESAVGVSVRAGVVTLHGEVTTYLQKTAAAKAALRVRGVGAVANDIIVRFPGDRLTDTDVAMAARAALESSAAVPPGLVKVEVRDRYAILTGQVRWHHEREAARKVVGQIVGVHGVDNRITLTQRPEATASEVAALIRQALIRQAALAEATVHVHTTGDTAELTGAVATSAERHVAEQVAWSSPHVRHVENRLVVAP